MNADMPAATPPEFEVGEASDEDIARSAADEAHTHTPHPHTPARPEPDLAARERIEALFEAARKDRSRTMALKQALDAHDVFAKYEDRFLDLFKHMD